MSDVMKRIFIALFAIAVLAESGVASAETKQVQFEGPVRLKQALNAIEKQGLLAEVYWPAVRLVKTDEAAELEQKKQKVLLQLDELEAYCAVAVKPTKPMPRLCCKDKLRAGSWGNNTGAI